MREERGHAMDYPETPAPRPDDDPTKARPGLLEAEATWSALRAMGTATWALQLARDHVLMAFGSTMAAASITLLHENANALVNELTQQVCDLATLPDPAVRAFILLSTARLRAEVAAKLRSAGPSTAEATQEEKTP
jgi:hypothetical protein